MAAPFAYAGPGRELLARLKYRNARGAVPWLTAAMAAVVDRDGLTAVTWVPTTTRRRRGRGFDQAELLARALARRLGLPCVRLLRRHPGPPQTGRPVAERRTGPRLEAVPTRVVPVAVLVVDDVVTSGATLSAAALALRGAGARRVDAVTAASTPLKLPRSVVERGTNGTRERGRTHAP
jgi:predicted amidophosphoribosyltransferase